MTTLPPARILVVDDERLARANLARVLEREGHLLRQAASGEEALALLRDEPADLVITDLAMPGMDGMALLRAVRAEHPQTEIIMVTGYPMIESAVEAMRQGAFHYLAKPYSLDEARLLVRRALEKCRLRQQVEQMRAQLEAEGHMPPMVGNSPAMRGLRQALQRLAPTDVAVLLQGETGTGKELAARTMHAQSQRARRRFLAVNCGALAPELLESELFGHEQGAFSGALRRKEGLFEAADGGTLFLDEIGEMPVPMQVKLLRVLQEQSLRRVGGTVDIPVDVRIIAATNRNLKDEVAAGRFRRDLYYRVAVVTQEVPPLRSRPEDIPLLARYFLEKLAAGKNAPLELDDAALQALCAYPFPGNVRELGNILERAAVFCPQGGRISPASLPAEVRGGAPDPQPADTPSMPDASPATPTTPTSLPPLSPTTTPFASATPPTTSIPFPTTSQTLSSAAIVGPNQPAGTDTLPTLAELEQKYILQTLERAQGNRTLAADLLGISRSSLWRKLRQYGVE